MSACDGSLSSSSQVLLCEVESAYSNVPQSVSVRSFGGHQERDGFVRECKLLASLSHPNVTRLIGVITDDEKKPFCSVLEHSAQGDLYHYLRQCTLQEESSVENEATKASTVTVTYKRLLEMVAQIAAGMKYLEGRSIVHKDLAARYSDLSRTHSLRY